MTLTIDGEIVDLARQRQKFHTEQAEKHAAAAERIGKRLEALDALMSELADGFGLEVEPDAPAQIEALKQPEPKIEGATLKERFKSLWQKHPEMAPKAAADELDCSPQQVYNMQSQTGLRFGQKSEFPRTEIQPKKPEPAPKPVAPYKPVPVPRHTPAHKQPAGTEFRLQDPETGKYLHEDINAMIANNGELHLVENKDYAWKGVESKLLTVRKVLPDTMDLREAAIVKVPA